MSGHEPIILQICCTKEEFHRLCRFCLSEMEEASLINLRLVKYEDTFIKDIVEQLFGNKIIFHKELPQNVCQKCIVEIIRCHNFKTTYDTSDVVLQAIIMNSPNKSCLDEETEEKSETIKQKTAPTKERVDDNQPVKEPIVLNSLFGKKFPRDLLSMGYNIKILRKIKKQKKPVSIKPTISKSKLSSKARMIKSKKLVARNTLGILKTENENLTVKEIISREDGMEKKDETGKVPAENPTIEEIISREDSMENEDETGRVPDDPKILEAKRLRCSCGETFAQVSEFSEHKSREKHRATGKNYFCELCKKFYNLTSYRDHLFTHTNHQKPYICEICSERFTSFPNLKRHIKTRHEGAKPYVCEICGNKFTTKIGLQVHLRTHTGEKPYLCDICGQTFGNQGGFDCHKRSHGIVKQQPVENKRYLCPHCGKILTTPLSYRKHINRQHTQNSTERKLEKIQNLACKQCCETFSSKRAFRTHMLTLHGEKAFSCNICLRSFSQAGGLAQHKRIHMGIKPYSCEFCSNTFRQLHHLQTHVRRIHTGERPFACEFCGKGFADRGALIVHTRIHTGERPYACGLCLKAFYHSTTMKKHRQTHLRNRVEKLDMPDLSLL